MIIIWLPTHADLHLIQPLTDEQIELQVRRAIAEYLRKKETEKETEKK